MWMTDGPCPLVQIVDVLGDQRQIAAAWASAGSSRASARRAGLGFAS